ncbi:MAG TPA: hypothetical protein VEH31_22685 [Streptosporangiaceae bacterium]|nr:hypothetical protein [Streptosporangiaceae bacterium]
MYDISRDIPAGDGMTVPASGGLLTRPEVNLRRNAAAAVNDRNEVSL